MIREIWAHHNINTRHWANVTPSVDHICQLLPSNGPIFSGDYLVQSGMYGSLGEVLIYSQYGRSGAQAQSDVGMLPGMESLNGGSAILGGEQPDQQSNAIDSRLPILNL